MAKGLFCTSISDTYGIWLSERATFTEGICSRRVCQDGIVMVRIHENIYDLQWLHVTRQYGAAVRHMDVVRP